MSLRAVKTTQVQKVTRVAIVNLSTAAGLRVAIPLDGRS